MSGFNGNNILDAVLGDANSIPFLNESEGKKAFINGNSGSNQAPPLSLSISINNNDYQQANPASNPSSFLNSNPLTDLSGAGFSFSKMMLESPTVQSFNHTLMTNEGSPAFSSSFIHDANPMMSERPLPSNNNNNNHNNYQDPFSGMINTFSMAAAPSAGMYLGDFGSVKSEANPMLNGTTLFPSSDYDRRLSNGSSLLQMGSPSSINLHGMDGSSLSSSAYQSPITGSAIRSSGNNNQFSPHRTVSSPYSPSGHSSRSNNNSGSMQNRRGSNNMGSRLSSSLGFYGQSQVAPSNHQQMYSQPLLASNPMQGNFLSLADNIDTNNVNNNIDSPASTNNMNNLATFHAHLLNGGYMINRVKPGFTGVEGPNPDPKTLSIIQKFKLHDSESITVLDLKKALKDHRLNSVGKKSVLMERLHDHLHSLRLTGKWSGNDGVEEGAVPESMIITAMASASTSPSDKKQKGNFKSTSSASSFVTTMAATNFSLTNIEKPFSEDNNKNGNNLHRDSFERAIMETISNSMTQETSSQPETQHLEQQQPANQILTQNGSSDSTCTTMTKEQFGSGKEEPLFVNTMNLATTELNTADFSSFDANPTLKISPDTEREIMATLFKDSNVTGFH